MMTESELDAIKARHDSLDVLSPSWDEAQEAHDDRAALLAEVERLQRLLQGVSRDVAEAGGAERLQTAAGCMCPSGANLHCQNSFCPRRNPPGVITCQGGKP